MPTFPSSLRLATLLLLGVAAVRAQEMKMEAEAMSAKPAAAKSEAKAPEKMDPAALEFFEKNIRPIFSEHCYKCHSAAEGVSKGGLIMDSRAALLAGGDQGPAVVPGNLKKSLLLVAVHQQDPELSMPPRKSGPKLSDAKIATLEKWVLMGAPAPAGGADKLTGLSQKARDHWAFKAVQDPAVPAKLSAPAWCQNEIDAFILTKLDAMGLKPNPTADGEALLRRLTYDLHGLPPTNAESDAFCRDFDAAVIRDAMAVRNGQPARSASLVLERTIDRLLASPRYGERWARHWLDTARYSDTKGLRRGGAEGDRSANAWTYRDYVIDSLNADKPYDQFIIEQLAADRLPDLAKDDPRLAALGFITVGKRFDNNDDTIDERIDTTTKGFLGLTVSCARCHDHKFDPIPAADYYSLHGVFASTIDPLVDPVIRGARTAPAAVRADYEKQLRQYMDENVRGYYKYVGGQLALLHKGYGARAMVALAGGVRSEKGYDLQQKYKDKYVVDREVDGAMMIRSDSPVTGPLARLRAVPEAQFAEKAPAAIAAALADKKLAVNPLVAEALRNLKPKSLDDVAFAYDALFVKHHDRIMAHLQMRGTAGKRGEQDDKAIAQLAAYPFPTPNYEDIATTTQMTVLVSTRAFCESWQSAPAFQNGNIPTRFFRFDAINALDLTHPGGPGTAMTVADAEKPRDTNVYLRGDRNKKGAVAPRQFLEILAGPDRQPFYEGSGRRELALAIANRTNPLTPRVLVNRVWLHHFGAGIVSSPDDFGNMAEKPTHPELLDWLSMRFMDDGWSLKKLHKRILMSATYRQSANPQVNALVAQKGAVDPLKIDAANKYLWHANLRRLDFESIRDSMLMLTGKMDTTLGGRPVNITEDPISYRRSIYGYIDRERLSDLQSQFDFADPDMANSKRGSTIVPQQALFFMNNELSIVVARAVAARPEVTGASSEDVRIAQLYKIMYQRSPTVAELKFARDFVRKVAGFIDEPVAKAKPAPIAKAPKPTARELMNKPLLPSAPLVAVEAAPKTKVTGAGLVNEGVKLDKRPVSPIEMLAQAMVCSNEFVYLN
jgi:cytochrome c553